MNYFAFQVKSRCEEKYLKLARKLLNTEYRPDKIPVKLILPRRQLTIRKQGKQKTSFSPIFPGYVFIEAISIDPSVYWLLKKINGFSRFLNKPDNVEPLIGDDKTILLHFLAFGEIVKKSMVSFDRSQKIRVKEGPMKGLEGNIIRVDKRKKRAKIALSLCQNSFLVDFGFEIIEAIENSNEK